MTAWPTPTAAADLARRCADCRHLSRAHTCLQPELAGLFPPGHGFGIAWPPLAHAIRCEAFAVWQAPEAHPHPENAATGCAGAFLGHP